MATNLKNAFHSSNIGTVILKNIFILPSQYGNFEAFCRNFSSSIFFFQRRGDINTKI